MADCIQELEYVINNLIVNIYHTNSPTNYTMMYLIYTHAKFSTITTETAITHINNTPPYNESIAKYATAEAQAKVKKNMTTLLKLGESRFSGYFIQDIPLLRSRTYVNHCIIWSNYKL